MLGGAREPGKRIAPVQEPHAFLSRRHRRLELNLGPHEALACELLPRWAVVGDKEGERKGALLVIEAALPHHPRFWEGVQAWTHPRFWTCTLRICVAWAGVAARTAWSVRT